MILVVFLFCLLTIRSYCRFGHTISISSGLFCVLSLRKLWLPVHITITSGCMCTRECWSCIPSGQASPARRMMKSRKVQIIQEPTYLRPDTCLLTWECWSFRWPFAGWRTCRPWPPTACWSGVRRSFRPSQCRRTSADWSGSTGRRSCCTRHGHDPPRGHRKPSLGRPGDFLWWKKID